MPDKKIEIIIADDHQMFIDGLKALLAPEADIVLCGEALNGRLLLELLKTTRPDMILLDINMPDMDGLQACREIKKLYPGIAILTLTMYNTREFINNLIKAGADGYILKNTGREELLEAIHTLAEGQTYYSKAVTDTLIQSLQPSRYGQPEPAAELSKRELEVIRLIAQELTTPEIADKLFISQHTVETHRRNILSKLNVKNTAGLMKYAAHNGLIEL